MTFTRIIILLFFHWWNDIVCPDVQPPSPDKVHDIINNPFLDPEIYEQFTGDDLIKSLSTSPPLPSPPTITNKKAGRKPKFATEEERKEANRKRINDHRRKQYAQMKQLPDSDTRKQQYFRKKYSNNKKYQDKMRLENPNFFTEYRKTYRERNPRQKTAKTEKSIPKKSSTQSAVGSKE